MMEKFDLGHILLAVASITYSIIFGIVSKKVWDVPRTVEGYLSTYSKNLNDRLQKGEEETKFAHRRLDVHDRISSKLIRSDFDSRAVVEQGNFPDVGRHG